MVIINVGKILTTEDQERQKEEEAGGLILRLERRCSGGRRVKHRHVLQSKLKVIPYRVHMLLCHAPTVINM